MGVDMTHVFSEYLCSVCIETFTKTCEMFVSLPEVLFSEKDGSVNQCSTFSAVCAMNEILNANMKINMTFYTHTLYN